MAWKRYFALAAALFVGMTITSRAQDLKNGTCPSNTSASYMLAGNGGIFPKGDEVNPFSDSRDVFSAPEYSPALLSATSVGLGAVGVFPLYDNYILRVSFLNLYPSLAPSFGVMSPYSEGALMPIEFGIRVPLVHSMLGTLGYTLYGETSAGLLLGWAVPTNGSFLSYSIPYSRFTTGASAYAGVGNTLRMDRYVGLYLNGGVGYFDLFSTSFMPRTSYLVPSVSIGFYFNIAG